MSSEPSSVLCSNSYCHDKNERQENINFACLTKSQKDNKSKTKTKKQKKKAPKSNCQRVISSTSEQEACIAKSLKQLMTHC